MRSSSPAATTTTFTNAMRLQLISLLLLPFLPVFSSQLEQIPMAGTVEPEYTPQTNLKPTLADLLTIESSASIFFSYARELEMSKMFADTSAKITLLVPTNKAVMALARKPCVSFTVGCRHTSETETSLLVIKGLHRSKTTLRFRSRSLTIGRGRTSSAGFRHISFL